MNSTIFYHLKKIIYSTTPLFKLDDGIIKIQGTCSFIRYKGYHFILTAEHVLKDYQNNLFILKDNESGRLLRPGGKSFLDSKNDIGIILLDDKTVKLIQDYYIFLDFSYKYCEEQKNAKFSFIGFPESK